MYFLPYIEGFILGMCGKVRKSIDFVGFLGGFGVFLLCCGYWNRYGIEKYCKNWKEKVFVLRMYFCMYMFCLRSGMFFAAAIEKKTDRAIPE